MKNKLMLLTAASAFSMAGIAADYTNIVLITGHPLGGDHQDHQQGKLVLPGQV